MAHDPHVATFAVQRVDDHVAEGPPIPDAPVGPADPGEQRPDEDHRAVAVVGVEVERWAWHRLET